MLPSVALAEDEQSATEQQTQVVSVIADTTRGSDQIETTVPEIDSTATSETQEQAPTVEESADSMDTEATGEQTTTAAEDSGETKGSNQSAANSSESIPATEAPKPLPESQPAKAPTNVETPADDSDSQDEPLTGEQYIDGHWYYYDESGKPVTGWHTWADGTRSYFGADGAALEGIQSVDGKTYYFDKSKACHTARWEQKIDGKTYYFNADYTMYTGWLTWVADKTRSYFGADGVAVPGWLNDGAKRYYANPTTLRTLRWAQSIDGKRYYFDADCHMWTGWLTWNADKTRSYFDPNSSSNGYGASLSGWQDLGGKRYYFDSDNWDHGYRWAHTLDGKYYYFDGSCAMQTGWVTWNADKSRSYFNPDSKSDNYGAALSGWQTVGGKRYYFDPKNSYHGLRWVQTLDGKMYYFDADCHMWKGWLTWNADKSRSYFGSDGAAIHGWKNDGKKRYYISPSTLHTVRWTQTIDGEIYYFDGSYVMHTGILKYSDGTVALFASDGAKVIGDAWATVGGHKYYVRDSVPVKWLQTIDNDVYYFDGNYQMVTGWLYFKSTGTWTYFDVATGKKRPGKFGWAISADGKTYIFYSSKGKLTTWNTSAYESWKLIKNKVTNRAYLVVIDQKRCFVNTYYVDNGTWAPLRTSQCCVGRNYRTPTGWSELTGGGATFSGLNPDDGHGEWYLSKVVYPQRTVYFHSILFKGRTKKVYDGRLGLRISNGCIRLPKSEAYWIFCNARPKHAYVYSYR